MRPSHEDETVVAGSVELHTSLWFALSQHFEGIWIEVLIVALALSIYLWQSQRSTWRWGLTKAFPDGSKKLLPKKSASLPGMNAAACLPGKGEEAKQVQKLVVSLLSRQRASGPAALLEEYDGLMKSCVNLRDHIPDDQNAFSMYLSLFECAVALPDKAPAPTMRGPKCIDRKASLVQQWAAQLLSDMQVQGLPRNVEFCASMVRLLVNGQHFKEAICLYDRMAADGIQANNAMLLSLLNASISAGQFKRALVFFEEAAKLSVPSVRSIMMVLRAHAANKDWQGAAKLLHRMESMGAQPDNIILNHVLGLCVSAGEAEGARQLLLRWKSLSDVISHNILLKGYAQQADMPQAESILQDMIANGPAPNLITYNTVMDCAVRCMQSLSADYPGRTSGRDSSIEDGNRQLDVAASVAAVARRPWGLLDQLLSCGLEPDRYTCSTLVKGMHLGGCSVHQIDRAVQLLNRIGVTALHAPGAGSNGGAAYNERLLEVIFNTLLDACISARDLDRMTSIFTMMQEFQINISAVTYGTLIKAFGQSLCCARCHEVWEDMLRAKIQPTIVTYGCYIDACIRNQEIERAEEVFESMSQGRGAVRPNAVIYTSLIRGSANAKKPAKAMAFYRRMREEGIEATSVTFNSVLDVVAHQSDPAMLQQVLDDMSKAGASPDAVTYSILSKASTAGNIGNALAAFRQIRGNGFDLDPVACNTVLLACSKDEQVSEAEDVFQEMLRLGMTPTHVTISIMVKMYGKAKLLDKAVAVAELQEREYGQKPNVFVYTCLIQACVQNKQVRRSWDLFNKMVSSGVEPDAVTYGTVIHGCVYLNKFQYAMALVRRAYQLPQCVETDVDCPFVFPSSSRKAVPLQGEVLHMLLAALKRKEQASLVPELEEILATCIIAPSDPSKAHGGRHGRRTRTSNPHV